MRVFKIFSKECGKFKLKWHSKKKSFKSKQAVKKSQLPDTIYRSSNIQSINHWAKMQSPLQQKKVCTNPFQYTVNSLFRQKHDQDI